MQLLVLLGKIYTLMHFINQRQVPQPVFTCSKLTLGTLEQGVKYVQIQQ